MFGRLTTELAITERHLRVLETVAEHEPIGLITLTNRLAYPRHKIRYSLCVLETEQLIRSTASGFQTTVAVHAFQTEANRCLANLEQAVEGFRLDEYRGADTPSDSATAN